MHVAIAEDDTDQAALLCHWLESGDHTARAAPTLAAFQELLKRERFDALLVDWMLPDATGDQVLTWVRENLGWELPTIVVTARDDEETVCAALKAGADDYVVKPPKPRELLARMTAVARRGNTRELPVLRLGTYEVDITRQRLQVAGEPVMLTQKEFDLATYLLQSPGKLLSRDHLLDRIWGIHADVDTRTVDTHVSRLRKKLRLDGSQGWRLVPIYGYGYRLDRQD